MNANVRRELDRIERHATDGRLALHDALERAYALGAETERLDLMHAACSAYSHARAERERKWTLEGTDSDPPPPPPRDTSK
jgi:hypothetical protein